MQDAYPDTKIDEVRAFMLWSLFGGDSKRTAAVLQVETSRIETLAHDFNWKAKISGRGLDTEEGQEKERGINRIVNYVTAERMRRVMSNLVDELDKDPSFAKAFCTQVDEDNKTHFSTKNLIELAKGIEIIANVSYRALQDKQAQAADVTGKGSDPAALALSTYKALVSRFDRVLAVDTTLEIAKAVNEVNTGADENGDTDRDDRGVRTATSELLGVPPAKEKAEAAEAAPVGASNGGAAQGAS